MFKGRANLESTKTFLQGHELHPSQQRLFCDVQVSSIAVGTYLGNMDEVTDFKVTKACVDAVMRGCNFFDTAINYRGQRAERAVGEAIKQLILSGKAKRDEIFISTKGGFVPYEGKPVHDLAKLFEQEYISKNLAKKSDLIAGCHCMEPKYILDQIERSQKNLQVETIDLYYLHNPETQLEELPERIFYDKLYAAFVELEDAVKAGKISAYGMATWNAFRDETSSQFSVQLEKCMELAKKAAHDTGSGETHFKAIQLPFNLAMLEAALVKSQKFMNNMLSAIEAAQALDLSVAVSVPLFQSRLCHGLPDFMMDAFPKELSQAHCAIAFASSWPGVDSIMVGMKQSEHVEHNLAFLKYPTLSEQQLHEIMQSLNL